MINNNIQQLIEESNNILDYTPEQFLEFLNTKIDYGYIDKNNKVYSNAVDSDNNELHVNYRLQIRDRLLKTKIGHCWDFVELERYFFNKKGIKNESYFICDDKLSVTHTILLYFLNGEIYYIESTWFKNQGIHKFDNIKEFWNYFISLFSKSNNISISNLEYHKYSEPTFAMTEDEFIGHCIGTNFADVYLNKKSVQKD